MNPLIVPWFHVWNSLWSFKRINQVWQWFTLSVCLFLWLSLSFFHTLHCFFYISLFLPLSLFSSVFPFFISPYNYIIVTLPFEKTFFSPNTFFICLSASLFSFFFLVQTYLSFLSIPSCVFLSLLFVFILFSLQSLRRKLKFEFFLFYY